ncbi:hypothetical protein, partial [Geminicoccus sp.]|uniref:hypothetical protein n=1 Tax=Geminicoccus sp. TaxID=2024832 RepID=UPI002E31286D
MLRRFLAAAALVPVMALGLAQAAQAASPNRCGGQYTSNNLYWRTVAPSLGQVMAQLPVGKRHTSGNMMSLDYRVDDAGRPVYRAEFAKQWQHIFGTNTATGYGRLVRGSW